MFKVLFCVLLMPVVWSANQFEVPGIRILVVTGPNPSDGQIRILRTANARNFTAVQLLKVEKSESEVAETLKYLDSTSNKENELLFLTPSDTMLMTQQSMILALRISQIALLGGGSVVMPYPQRNASSIPTKYDEELSNLEDTLEDDYAFTDNSPRPTTLEQWKKSLRPYAKLKYLQVKQKQEQRKKAVIKDSRFCALVGLTIAIKESLKTFMESPLSKTNGSLAHLCSQASTFGSIRHEMRIVYDSSGKIFNFASSRPAENASMSYAAAQDGSMTIQSPNYEVAPVLFDTHNNMPFDISNMASGEIGLKSKPCPICPDNEIEDLEKYFGSKKNYPIVHLIVAKSVDFLGLDELIENLNTLTYPKSRTILSFVMSYKNGSNYVNDILNKKKGELGKIYMKTSIVSAPEVPAFDLYEKMWEVAKTLPSDVLFIIDPSVRFSDLEIIEHLLKHNRRMISPLLKISEEEYNFVPDRNGNELAGNPFGGPFTERTESGHFSYRGLLQIPLAFGAIMLRRDVALSIDVPLQTCFMECDNDDDVECHDLNEKKKEENCKTSYYNGINVPEMSLWGMMFKQIQEQGIIPFVSNLHDYGRLIL